jgi:hypothetical protein
VASLGTTAPGDAVAMVDVVVVVRCDRPQATTSIVTAVPTSSIGFMAAPRSFVEWNGRQE